VFSAGMLFFFGFVVWGLNYVGATKPL